MHSSPASAVCYRVLRTVSASITDPRKFPSLVGIDIMLADQIGEYNEGDLQKIAMDIKAGVPHAQDAFHYVYSRMMGWE